MEVEESKLRPRPPFTVVPKIEETDSKYKDLILALPKEEGWPPYALRKYQGFWFSEPHFPGLFAMQESFKARSDDVIVASFMKSGTTWLKALTFTVMHRHKFPDFSCHPLLKLNPHDCVPTMEHHYATRDEHYLETLPTPRVLGTHLSYSMLSDSIKTSHCKIVYICREPKDVLVSLWHMYSRFEWLKKTPSFNQAFELFCEGRVPYGPVWEHVVAYHTKSLSSLDEMLFLKYEEMLKDPIDGVVRLANFIGCPFSEEEMKDGVVEKIVKLCSFNELKDLDVNKNGVGNMTNSYFFRKAVVGDWHNYMTPDMANKIDEITNEKFRDSSFTY